MMSQPPATENRMIRTQTACLVVLTLIATGFAMYFLQSVLLPFVISLFIVSGVRPILDFLEIRLGLHWILAFAVTFLAGVLLLIIFLFMIWVSVNDLRTHAPAYQQRINSIVEWFSARFPDSPGPEPAEDVIPPPDPASAEALPEEGAENGLRDLASERVDDLEEKRAELVEQSSQAIKDLLASLGEMAQSLIVSLAGMLTSLMSYGVLILIFVFFLLLGRSNKNAYRPQIVRDIDEQIQKYIIMKTVISALTGLATTIVLWLFGVPLAVVFGMLAFLLNFIPNIGPVISMLLPVPFLVLNPEMPLWAAITVFVLICSIQFISGNVIETRVMGKSFDVSPVVLLLALMFFGLVWGIVGMFLATPMVSIIKIVLNQQPATRPVAELLAGRWQRPAGTS